MINELRINNWVSFVEDANKYKDYHKVTNISNEEILCHNGDVKCDIYPIPLTLEILEQCDFDGNNYKRRYKKILDTVITMYFENNEFSIQDYDWFELKMPHIKTLHQLQNLYFALTGEELKVQLSEPKVD